jgi:hypothetical protein
MSRGKPSPISLAKARSARAGRPETRPCGLQARRSAWLSYFRVRRGWFRVSI